jgi:hypothetical protein
MVAQCDTKDLVRDMGGGDFHGSDDWTAQQVTPPLAHSEKYLRCFSSLSSLRRTTFAKAKDLVRGARRGAIEKHPIRGVFLWLALANELRTASMDYDKSEVRNIKGLLLSVA